MKRTRYIPPMVAASDLQRDFKRVSKMSDRAPVVILKNNQPDKVIMSVKDFEKLSRLQEQLEDLQD